uniref:Uncharacterized protein n=1 Tax=Pristionchus pacificus TaxID=54126 RepID=A0A2A6BZG8_PRIPA|eukprot:PDM71344.1 hypothetical protein PRIPAC_37751 [Pristionchus pacificus]
MIDNGDLDPRFGRVESLIAVARSQRQQALLLGAAIREIGERKRRTVASVLMRGKCASVFAAVVVVSALRRKEFVCGVFGNGVISIPYEKET